METKRGAAPLAGGQGGAPMRRAIKRPSAVWIAAALILVVIALTGCVEVEVRDATPPADTFTSPLVPGQRDRNLAILAVEFDPPLDYKRLIVRESVTLLVAVENTGSRTEREVGVEARLSSPEDARLLLKEVALIESIAPGEIQVVRFPQLGDIPYHWDYHLDVVLDALEGESNLSDNTRSLDIQIRER
jgi:hypothetical protein